MAQGLSQDCIQAVGRGSSHLKAQLGLEDLLSSSLTRLLADVRSALAFGHQVDLFIRLLMT